MAGPWKQIIGEEMDLLEENIDLSRIIKALPGLDSKVMFWFDRWVGDAPLKSLFPELNANKVVLWKAYEWLLVLASIGVGNGSELWL